MGKTHVVKSGDTLTGLAKKYYGDPNKYMIIYEANKEVIGDDPDLIIDGTELIIPSLPGEEKGKQGLEGPGPKSI
jgi:nucleoid-associated protein YgaU